MTALPCPPELWPAFSALLDTALALPESEREPWLRTLGAEHAAVLPWLQKVLAHSGERVPADFLDAPPALLPAGDGSAAANHRDEDFHEGQMVGPYRLLRRIGEGGMGVVWLASRADGAYVREVALKLPHAHLLSGAIRNRFRRERDILAALAHPHVAQFHDAGLGDDGQPYLALEYVEGVPLTHYCRAHRLPVSERLRLMLQVLSAVQHAHARLIVHRDLKPSNVLVTAAGDVKLLDFGIAKLLNADDSDEATRDLTRLAGPAATPDYAAPEQLAGQPITVAADIHALGVMLYELLCGSRPYDSARPRRPGLSREHSPRPEARLASLHVTPAAAAEAGGISAKALRKAIAGDLDAILAKAIDPDPARRYLSIEAFSADLRRHAQHQPILARHIGPRTRAWKFIRRHRLGVLFSATLAAVVLVGVAGVLMQARETRREAMRAQLTKDFLVNMFKFSDPRIALNKPRGQITAKEMLDLSVMRLEQQFAADPETQIELLQIVSDLYTRFGETDLSLKLTRRSRELAGNAFGEASTQAVESRLQEIWTLESQSRNEDAKPLLAEVDPLIHRGGLDDTPQRAEWWLFRAESLRSTPGAFHERVDNLERAIALFARVAPEAIGYSAAIGNLSNALYERGEFQRSYALQKQASEILAHHDPDNIGQRGLLDAVRARPEAMLGRLADAEADYQHGIADIQRTYGEKHRYYWYAVGAYARLLHLTGRREQADREYQSLLALLPANWSGETQDAEIYLGWGNSLAAEGRSAEAIPFIERAIGIYRQRSLRESDMRRSRLALGDALDQAGRTDEARVELQAARDEYVAQEGGATFFALSARERWARFLEAQGDIDGAEREFSEVLRLTGPAITAASIMSEAGLAQIALRRGQLAAAQSGIETAVKHDAGLQSLHDVRQGPMLWRIQARVLDARGDSAEAARLRAKALEASRRYDAPDSPTVGPAADAV